MKDKGCGIMAAKNKSYYIKSGIGIAIMVFFGYIPPLGAITPMGMHVLGIYIGLLYLWSVVDVIWPSFMGLFMLGLRGYATISDLIVSGWGNATNVYIVLICIFSYFVTKSGVSDILVNKIISRKFAKGKPWMISFLFLAAAYTVGAVVSMTPACLIVWAIFTKYIGDLGYKKSESYPVLMIVGIALAGLMGFSLFPFRPPASILMGMAQEAGVAVPFVSFVTTSFLIGFGSLIIYLLICKYVVRPDITLLSKEYNFDEADKMTTYQKQILLLTVILIILFIIQSAFGTTAIGSFLSKFGTSGIVLAMLTIMIFIRTKNGEPFVDIIDATRFGVVWPVFYLLTIGMTIGVALSDNALGIGQTLAMALDPIFGREGGPVLFAAMTVFFTIFTTNFMYNHTAAMIVYNVAILYCGKLNINPALLVCLIGVSSNASIIFPSANPIAAVMHGMKDWVTAKDIYKYSIPLAIAVWIVASLAWITVGNIMF